MKTAIKVLYRSLGATAGAAILFVNFSVTAQSLFVSSYTPGVIDEIMPGGRLNTFVSGLSYPYLMAVDRAGNLFVANSANDGPPGNILEITPDGAEKIFASGVDPKGLAFNKAGDLFESDYHSGLIYKFTPEGERSVFASGFSAPQALAFNSAGDLFVAAGYPPDNGNCSITEITPDGTQSRFASGLGGTAGLAFNSAGDLFEADSSSGNIYEFTPDGTRSTFASGIKPTALAFDCAGDLFDSDDGCVYEFTPDGTRSTIATGIYQPIGIIMQPASWSSIPRVQALPPPSAPPMRPLIYPRETETPGRYQLFTADVACYGPSHSKKPQMRQITFKLDTATGRTWMFTCDEIGGVQRIGWVELSDIGQIGQPLPETCPARCQTIAKP